jgi:hypothetical protein
MAKHDVTKTNLAVEKLLEVWDAHAFCVGSLFSPPTSKQLGKLLETSC